MNNEYGSIAGNSKSNAFPRSEKNLLINSDKQRTVSETKPTAVHDLTVAELKKDSTRKFSGYELFYLEIYKKILIVTQNYYGKFSF